MSYTKGQFVEGALTEIGIAPYVFESQPQALESALYRLDSMIATWNGQGIRLGYPLPNNPQDSSLDEPTDVPDSANDAIICSLAVRIAPSYGKTVQPATLINAQQGYNTLLSRATYPPPLQLPATMPSGAGNKPWRVYDNPFIQPPVIPIDAGPDGPITYG